MAILITAHGVVCGFMCAAIPPLATCRRTDALAAILTKPCRAYDGLADALWLDCNFRVRHLPKHAHGSVTALSYLAGSAECAWHRPWQPDQYPSCTLKRVAEMKKKRDVHIPMMLSCAKILTALKMKTLSVEPIAPASTVIPAASSNGRTCAFEGCQVCQRRKMPVWGFVNAASNLWWAHLRIHLAG